MLADWADLLHRLGVSKDPRVSYAKIEDAYSSPPRACHNLGYIRRGIEELADAEHLCKRPEDVELAFWLHKTVYRPFAHDNEERSAVFAHTFCADLGVSDSTRRNVGSLILSPTRQNPSPVNGMAVFLDLDVTILGAPHRDYERYESQKRDECWSIPSPAYRKLRIAELKTVLSRPRIYATDHFKELYEERARRNIIRSLTNLQD